MGMTKLAPDFSGVCRGISVSIKSENKMVTSSGPLDLRGVDFGVDLIGVEVSVLNFPSMKIVIGGSAFVEF